MDLKEINEKLYPHNARFLINSKPYYFNILNIPFDQEITTIEFLRLYTDAFFPPVPKDILKIPAII